MEHTWRPHGVPIEYSWRSKKYNPPLYFLDPQKTSKSDQNRTSMLHCKTTDGVARPPKRPPKRPLKGPLRYSKGVHMEYTWRPH